MFNEKIDRTNKLYFPEPLYDFDNFPFSIFLFFNNEPISFTLPPTTFISLLGRNPFEFYQIVLEKRPLWMKKYQYIFSLCDYSMKQMQETTQLLEPFRNKSLNYIQLTYPRTETVIEDNRLFIESANMNRDNIYKLIDLKLASNEFIAHLFIEKYSEFYDKSEEIKINRKEVKSNFNYLDLYNYCDKIMNKYSIEELYWFNGKWNISN